MYRVLIVDDERLAREKIRTFLLARGDVEIAGEAANVSDAVALIERERPDLVLLDIQMPGGDGFDVLRANPAAVIFVTAHDDHAIRAFDVAAVDYLLKPFERRRFNEAIDRARSRSAAPLVFMVRKRDRTIIVPAKEVHWIAAEGKYVRIHTGGESHLVRDTIAGVARRLDAKLFVRIHRATIVNLRRVAELRDDGTLLLRDGTPLAISRRFRARVITFLRDVVS